MNVDKIIEIDSPMRGFLPKQIQFMEECERRDGILYSGAFRAGKTLVLVHKAISLALENPKVIGLLGSPKEAQVDTVIFKMFLDAVDDYQAKMREDGINLKLIKRMIRSAGVKQIDFYNGSIIYFRACNDERNFAGLTLDFAGLDEPVDMDESIFTQLLGRISGTKNIDGEPNLNNNFIMLATNPADELHWLYKYFFLMKDKKFIAIETSTRDNLLLPKYDEYIKRCEKKWDRDWVLRYLDGKWGMFEGAIYKEFNPQKHMGDYADLPVKYTIAGVDWGLRDPYVILVAGVTNDDRLVIIKEYYGNNKSTHELSKLLAVIHKEMKFRKVYCDPAAADLILQSYNRGVPIGQKKGNIIKSFADNDISSGIARMQSLFKNNMIMIDKNCEMFRKEHSSYRYKEGTEKPIDKHNHTCDAARYLTTDFDPYRDDSVFDVIYWKLRKWE